MLQWVRHTSTLYGMKSGLQLFQRVYRFIKVFWMVRHSIRAILYNARNDLSMHRLVTEHPRATREKWQARFASGPTAYGVNPDYSHAESRKERSGPNARCSFVKLSSTHRPFFFLFFLLRNNQTVSGCLINQFAKPICSRWINNWPQRFRKERIELSCEPACHAE